MSQSALRSVADAGDAAIGVKEVNVLVTGYGPFLDKYPVNSSWSVASNLPAVLPPTAAHPTPIRIHVHPDPIRVSYSAVRDIVPKLHAQPYDIILHIGLAAGRTYYTLERLAYRDRFDRIPDVDGVKFKEAEQIWHDVPIVMRPSFNCEDVWRRWRTGLSDHKLDVRPSDDPGNYLCGFIYYSSLAYLYKKGQDVEKPVMFLHVPDLPTPKDVRDGVDVAISMIRALVESRERSKTKGQETKVPKEDKASYEGCGEEQMKMGEYPETWAAEQQN